MRYLLLMRLHKPIGILLLWLPTAWALWIANSGHVPLNLSFLFLCGTILMRSAGCVINDIADRHIDLYVKRTHLRPLASGEISLLTAFILLFVLLSAALILLFQLPRNCFYYAVLAIFIVFVYPFCKRFIQFPQCVLGLAFSMGIPMAYAASSVLPDSTMAYLLIINFLWIVAYDTQYAMADREDDLRLGVKSTAILFADYDRMIIGLLQILLHSAWLFVAFSLHYSLSFYGCWVIALFFLLYQQTLIAKRQPECCIKAFSSNGGYGFLMWLGIILSY